MNVFIFSFGLDFFSQVYAYVDAKVNTGNFADRLKI